MQSNTRNGLVPRGAGNRRTFFFDRVEGRAQRFVEFRAVGGRADRIQFEIPIRDAEAVEQRGQHLQQFRIASGRLAAGGCGADDFGVDLIELPIPALLRPLAAELRADVVELIKAAIP